MLRYSNDIEEWIDPQRHIDKLAVNVTNRSLRVREAVQGYHQRGSLQFPGMQPVSMTAHNAQLLRSGDYAVAFKTDGIRAFMTLLPNDKNVYLTARDMNTYRLHAITKQALFGKKCARGLLYQLDGELICYRSAGSICFAYIPHDVLTYRGQCVEPLSFRDRMNCLNALINEDELSTQDNNINNKFRRKPQLFKLSKKSFLHLSVLQSMQQSGCGVPTDGFIFQSWRAPYVRGSCSYLLKWKPSEWNSVDFRIYVSHTETPGTLKLSYTCSDGSEVHSETVAVSNKSSELRALSLHGKIVECVRAPDRDEWIGKRIRDDKLQPNSLSTYQRVLQSIQDSISWQQLLQYATVTNNTI